MKISALIVTFNEAKHLRECLKSLCFCDQIMVVDLGSSDGSVEIAREFATDFISHTHVPVVEEIWVELFPKLKYEWIIRADPDEIFPSDAIATIDNIISSDTGALAIINIPYQYYFRGKPLHHTVWGGIRFSSKVINRNRVNLFPRVHRGIIAKPDNTQINIPYNGNNAVKHFWADSFGYLFSKHSRYLSFEGKSRYEHGFRFTWQEMMRLTFKQLKRSLIKSRGWRGGWNGIFLSFYYGYYEAASWLALRKFQNMTSDNLQQDTRRAP